MGPSCFGSPARMMFVLGSARVLTLIIASGSVAWPASSMKICVKWPRGSPIPAANEAETHVVTMTLKCLILIIGTPKCIPSFRYVYGSTSSGTWFLCRDGAMNRKSFSLFKTERSFVTIRSEAELLGAHARMRAAGLVPRTCKMASITVLVFPVPKLRNY